MSETANAFKLSGNGRLSSAGSVGMTPPRSPAMNRVPSAFLIKEVFKFYMLLVFRIFLQNMIQ